MDAMIDLNGTTYILEWDDNEQMFAGEIDMEDGPMMFWVPEEAVEEA